MSSLAGSAGNIESRFPLSNGAGSGEQAEAVVVGQGRIVSGTATARTPSSQPLRGMLARDVISATEICRFARCRHQHLFAEVHKLRETRLQLDPYFAKAELPASVRGDLVHDALRQFHERRGVEIRDLVTSAVRAHPVLQEPIACEVVDEIVEEVRLTLAHPHMLRLRHAQLWPAPRFSLRLTPWLTVTGEMDLVALWPDGRVEIVDYKTDRMPAMADDIAWREERVHHHALQAALYAMACEATLGPVSRFDFVFTHHAIAAAAPVDAATLSDARRRVLEIAAIITTGDSQLYGDAKWAPDRCNGCPWLRTCRPAGLPTSA